MGQPHERFGLEILVELITAEQGQSPSGTPVERIEGRLKASVAIARKAGLDSLVIHLDRTEFGWLCNALGVDRLSNVANALRVDFVPVKRTKPGMNSHITGAFVDGHEPGTVPFPLLGDPSKISNFVQRVSTHADRAELLGRLKAAGRAAILEDLPESGTMH